MRRRRAVVGVALVAMVIVAGCSANRDSSGGGSSAGSEAQVAPAADQAMNEQDRSAQAAPADSAGKAGSTNTASQVRLVDLSNAGGTQTFTVLFRDRDGQTVHAIKDLTLPMPGRHNALNATSAVAVAHELKIPDAAIRKALAGFGGVKRRFTRAGEWNGVTIIDDYGHHPVEIAAVLKAARESTKGQVIAVVQPHRFTRLQSLFEPFSTCFNDADAVVVAEVYAAGETPIDGVDRDHLVIAVRARGWNSIVIWPFDPAVASAMTRMFWPFGRPR